MRNSWRYIGVWSETVSLCAARVRVGRCRRVLGRLAPVHRPGGPDARRLPVRDRATSWNAIVGLNDTPPMTENTLWLDGVQHPIGPVTDAMVGAR